MARENLPRSLHNRPRVALIVETSLASGRDILRGIARYVRAHGPWSVYHEPRALEEAVPRWLQGWDGDGIVARIQNTKIADAVIATGLPVVDVLGQVPKAGVPLVHVDNHSVARLGAEHLMERGFQHFAFCSVTGAAWSDARRTAFTQIVAKAGFDCAVCELPSPNSWEKQKEQLTDWVRSLPRPVGIMVASDSRGQLVLEACRRAGVAVPEEAAVVGVDNDEPLCEICDPQLSSVMPNHRQVGYEGAMLLDQLMGGTPPPAEPIYVLPVGIITRLSTEVLAIDDPEIAASLRFIREYACDGINTDDVVERVSLSRSTLQRRFRKVLGRSVHDEILRIRIRRARELLAQTDLPIEIVSDKAGFSHRQYLGEVFRAKTGETLAGFRRKFQE